MAAKKGAGKRRAAAKKRKTRAGARKPRAKRAAAKKKSAVKLPVIWPSGGTMVWDVRTFLHVMSIAKSPEVKKDLQELLEKHSFEIPVPSEFVNGVKEVLYARGLHEVNSYAQWITTCPCDIGKFYMAGQPFDLDGPFGGGLGLHGGLGRP